MHTAKRFLLLPFLLFFALLSDSTALQTPTEQPSLVGQLADEYAFAYLRGPEHGFLGRAC